MRRLVNLMLVLMVVVLAGCSQEAAEPVSVTDTDAVFEFVSNTYPDMYTREDFDKWTPFYMDITQDGNDEVVYTTTYWDGHLESAIAITCDEGECEIIPSNIEFAKYENNVAFEDGFLLISRKCGGSGMFLTSVGVYVYDGNEIKYTGADIVIEDVVANPQGYLLTGELEGEITDFVYTAIKEDYATGKTSVVEKARYVYDAETMTFTIEEMSEGTQAEEVVGPINTAILNYEGDGLERLEQVEIDCSDNSFDFEFVDGTTDKIAIFGEVTDVKIGYSRRFTEGNYMLIKEFDNLKDTELVIHRSAEPEDMCIVSFYDGGMREHTYHIMTDEYYVSEDPIEQQLVAELDEKDKLPTTYEEAADLFICYLGMTDDEFKNNNNFANVGIKYSKMEGEPYFYTYNEPLGYDVTFSCDSYGGQGIEWITIVPSNEYASIKDSAKKSFFGVDLDMSIYGARYNLNNTRDDIEVIVEPGGIVIHKNPVH